MAVAELLTEIAKPKYAGKSDPEIVAMLNEWQRKFVPCPTKALSIKFAEVGLQGSMDVAREQKAIDDDLWKRWRMLLGVMADKNIDLIMFDERKIAIADMLNSLLRLEVIDKTEHIWLTDLGVRSWTMGRRTFDRDVTEDDVKASRELAPLHEKVMTRREELKKKHAEEIADLQATHDELQKRDGQQRPIGDRKHVPKWEK